MPGPAELIVIAAVLLFFVGPARLQSYLKSAGQLFFQIKKQKDDLKSTLNEAVKNAEKELELEDVKKMKENIIDIKNDVEKDIKK